MGGTNGREVPAGPAFDADLVVVGFGCAGAAAAIAAADAGAEVLLLEKQAADRHTPSVRMSGGLVMTANDPVTASAYLVACAAGHVPNAVSEAWAEHAAGLLSWLESAGIDADLRRCGSAEHADFEGAGSIEVYQPGSELRLDPATGAGRALFAALQRAVEARPRIRVLWGTPGERLLRSPGGRVTGVQSGERSFRARAGVVLTCGGFEMDTELKRSFLPASPTFFYGNPGNTGDGVRMAAAIGADLWHMNMMVGRAVGNFELEPGREQCFMISIAPAGYVITDRQGRRFANEDSQARFEHDFYYELLAFAPKQNDYPRIPCFWFFDERRRRAGPIVLTHVGACSVGLYDWSEDNSREVDRGWIHRGSTIEEAASGAGLNDPGAAAATVAEYNASCRAGARDALGRSQATMLPLEQPPYYCVPLWPGGSNTSGGPRRDELARVLDPFGVPIEGLYAAGELGQAIGRLYPADGSNLSEALCFGRAAAETALREAAAGTHTT